MRKQIDILCAGELLVDFITADFAETLDEVENFKRIPGGSPANLCMNMARVGNKTVLVASVGKDDMGAVLRNYVQNWGVDVSHITTVDEPTTLILVTRSKTVSNFQPYRGADYMLSIRQFPYGKFEEVSVFHTTCFALSKNPAQQVIMQAADRAVRAGCRLSLDANYAEKIWPDQREAQSKVSEYCRMGAFVKVSDVDWGRLYGESDPHHEAVIEHFLKLGAKQICYTLGDKGLWAGNDKEMIFVEPRKIEIKDTTGAGDAFWSGYLTAYIDGKTMHECALAGRKMAELKLSHFGPLPANLDKNLIYSDF